MSRRAADAEADSAAADAGFRHASEDTLVFQNRRRHQPIPAVLQHTPRSSRPPSLFREDAFCGVAEMNEHAVRG